jgi:hypothetical protein
MNAAGLTLRDRLRALRRGTLDQLDRSDRIDGGLLRLVADASTVLAQLDAEADTAVVPVPGDRCIVSDDGHEIAITVYSSDRRCAAATLSPAAAIRLGGQLVAAGARRL